jgi:hypothetical protein
MAIARVLMFTPPTITVGAVTIPVKVGLASGALNATDDVVAYPFNVVVKLELVTYPFNVVVKLELVTYPFNVVVKLELVTYPFNVVVNTVGLTGV